MRSLSARPLAWGLFAVLLGIAPLLFDSGAALSILCQAGTMMIFALSYNMLLGQGGMLSFGHAVYSGLGAFCAAHAMNLAGAGTIWLPVALVPLAGGVAGMLFGVLFGYLTTRKSGTTFAMITLGLGELTYACALMFPEYFGGEGGVPTNRVYGDAWMGIDFGPQRQVYYLIACWLLLAAAGMHAFTGTPLGRMLNAVRDNPERAEFIGYDARRVRYLTLILSGFFAGISGALGAINFEIVGAENLGSARSGAVLLFTVIGGTGYFFGPMLGAAAGVFLTVALPAYTPAWQLYLGIFFILTVMYAPGGLSGIFVSGLRLARHGSQARRWPLLLKACAASASVLAGAVMCVEMLYRLALDSAGGTVMRLFGLSLDSAGVPAWCMAVMLIAAGSLALRAMRPRLAQAWDDAGIGERVRRAAA